MISFFAALQNGQALPIENIPVQTMSELRSATCQQVRSGERLLALFIMKRIQTLHLVSLLADDRNGRLWIASAPVGESYPSFTPDCSQAHLFEREIFEEYGILPEGHPWLKPVRFPLKSRHQDTSAGNMDFYRVEGPDIHEVAVGPVHAGIIEPGHFRFQCQGEIILSLEISLGYQHRGVIRNILSSIPGRRRHLVESVSGDASAAHGMAYSRLVEAFCGIRIPARAKVLRGIALELERAACHVGDLGALAGDIGFQPTSARCGWIRGNVLNLTAELCGNRFSRGLCTPGGVRRDIEDQQIAGFLDRLRGIRRDTEEAYAFFRETPSVLARIEGTGTVSREDARSLGMVGPAARASGLRQDVRQDHPEGIYRYHQIPIASDEAGDVQARARIRWIELQRSLTFIEESLQSLPRTAVNSGSMTPRKNVLAIALSEGWRGEVAYIGATGETGELEFLKIIDPSFRNWAGLSFAVRGEGISDFPLCNKSFNLSYCGFDL